MKSKPGLIARGFSPGLKARALWEHDEDGRFF
jgi:hypothetical protein